MGVQDLPDQMELFDHMRIASFEQAGVAHD